MEMVRTIKLSGPLASRFGHVHRIAVNSVAEASRALCVLIPGFEKFLMESKERGLVYAIHVDRDNIGEDSLTNPLGSAREIRIVPIVSGAKKVGLLQVIAGAALIVAGLFTAGASWTIMGVSAKTIGGYMVGMGISMVVGGVVQMLTPTPKISKDENKRSNYTFNGSLNVQAQGVNVPVLYGKMFTGSVVVSAGITAEDNYLVPTGGERSSGGHYSGGGSMIGNVIARVKSEYDEEQ